MRRTLPLIGSFCAAVCAGFVTNGQALDKSLYLGVIEHSLADCEGYVSTTPYMVRAAFHWKGNDWKALPDKRESAAEFPERATWTIALDGKNLGQIHTTRPPDWEGGSHIGLLQPDPREKLNPIPSPPEEFPYFFCGGYDRPIVVVSKPNFTDPDQWKAADVPEDVVRRLIPFFRKEVASIPLSCVDESTDNPHGPYADSLIQVRKSYVSAAGARLVQLALPDSAAPQCDVDEEWDAPRWFYVRGETIRVLGASLYLIDAGDYDGDGHSEAVFLHDAYNYNGYVLFYDGFRKQAEFGWTYN